MANQVSDHRRESAAPGLIHVTGGTTQIQDIWQEVRTEFGHTTIESTRYSDWISFIAGESHVGRARIGRSGHLLGVYGGLKDNLGLQSVEQNRTEADLLADWRDTDPSGSWAHFDLQTSEWTLRSDSLGAMPLYYLSGEGFFLFSSSLPVLRRLASLTPDYTGCIQYLRKGYTIHRRTFFQEVAQVLPLEEIRAESTPKGIRISRHDCEGLGLQREPIPSRSLRTSEIWDALIASQDVQVPDVGLPGIMASGGWDSRILIAALSDVDRIGRPLLYSHGNPESRELNLVRAIGDIYDLPVHIEPLKPSLLDAYGLAKQFSLSGDLKFPHWSRAGQVLRQAGCTCSISGVLGEVLGGHYGPAFYYSGWRKGRRVYKSLLGLDRLTSSEQDRSNLIEHFAPHAGIRRPRYLATDWWKSRDDVAQQIRADVFASWDRWRGIVNGPDWRVLELFTITHRGARFQAEQARAQAPWLPIANPFWSNSFLSLSLSLNIEDRIYNVISRRLLLENARKAARLPLAATLLPAGAPTFAREASRGARVVLSHVRRGPRRRTTGDRGAKSAYSWVDFSFMSQPSAWEPLVAELRSDLWDRSHIENRLYSLRDNPSDPFLHPHFFQLLKMLTVEWHLRERD